MKIGNKLIIGFLFIAFFTVVSGYFAVRLIQSVSTQFKGAAGNLSAIKIFSIAKSIEEIGRNGDLANVRQFWGDLKSEISRLNDYITNL